MIPSRLHRSLTVTSRRKPSRTTRIFSSGVYLRRVAAFTVRTKDLVSSLRCWAASALLSCDWDTVCSFHEVLYPRFRSSHHSQTLGFSTPLRCPIFADGLQCRFLDGCSRECWIVSADYRRRQAEGECNHDLAKRESALQGVGLSSMRFHPIGREPKATKTDKKGGLRLQTHPLSDRPTIDWPCRT